MKRRIDKTFLIGITLFLFGTISTLYGITTLIINLFLGYTRIIILVKDVLFDPVFILLGLLLIRRNKKTNFRSNQIKRQMPK